MWGASRLADHMSDESLAPRALSSENIPIPSFRPSILFPVPSLIVLRNGPRSCNLQKDRYREAMAAKGRHKLDRRLRVENRKFLGTVRVSKERHILGPFPILTSFYTVS